MLQVEAMKNVVIRVHNNETMEEYLGELNRNIDLCLAGIASKRHIGIELIFPEPRLDVDFYTGNLSEILREHLSCYLARMGEAFGSEFVYSFTKFEKAFTLHQLKIFGVENVENYLSAGV